MLALCISARALYNGYAHRVEKRISSEVKQRSAPFLYIYICPHADSAMFVNKTAQQRTVWSFLSQLLCVYYIKDYNEIQNHEYISCFILRIITVAHSNFLQTLLISNFLLSTIDIKRLCCSQLWVLSNIRLQYFWFIQNFQKLYIL